MELSKKNKYTIVEKLKVIAKKYGIDRSSIRDWQKQENKLKSQTNFKKFKIEGTDAQSELPKEKKMNLYHGFYKIENLIYQLLLLF